MLNRRPPVARPARRRSSAARAALLLLLAACAAPTPATPAPPAPPAPPVAPAAPAAHAPHAAPSAPTASVPPGLNAPFLDPDADVAAFTATFEGESREIAKQAPAIVAALGLEQGMSVADVGAGTGLFMERLAEGVGRHGAVYALDIAPAFLAHLRERALRGGLAQVNVVACSDRSVNLPSGSLDLAFVCDTYHHFEHPGDTLASLRDALRPGGALVIVDFERAPGTSRDWVLQHVRAGKSEVRAEIEAAGFRFAGEVRVDGLRENYVLRFERP